MGPLSWLAFNGLARKLTLMWLVSVKVMIRGGDTRKPAPTEVRTWVLKPWPLDRMEVVITLPLWMVRLSLGPNGLEPLT